MEGAVVDGRFAEEAGDDLVAAAILDGEGDARGDRDVATDDAVAAEEVAALVEEVHRAALAAHAAVGAAEELGHDRAGGEAARERLPVVPVRGDHVVIGAKHREGAGGDRFLSDVEVAEAADLSERVGLGAALLEAALEEHGAEQLAVEGDRGGVGLLAGHHEATPAAWTCSQAW